MDPDIGATRSEVRAELADVRGEMRGRFARVDEEFRQLRSEMRAGFDGLDGRIDALQVTLLRVGGGSSSRSSA